MLPDRGDAGHASRPENVKYLTRSHCFSAGTTLLCRRETFPSFFVLVLRSGIGSGKEVATLSVYQKLYCCIDLILSHHLCGTVWTSPPKMKNNVWLQISVGQKILQVHLKVSSNNILKLRWLQTKRSNCLSYKKLPILSFGHWTKDVTMLLPACYSDSYQMCHIWHIHFLYMFTCITGEK